MTEGEKETIKPIPKNIEEFLELHPGKLGKFNNGKFEVISNKMLELVLRDPNSLIDDALLHIERDYLSDAIFLDKYAKPEETERTPKNRVECLTRYLCLCQRVAELRGRESEVQRIEEYVSKSPSAVKVRAQKPETYYANPMDTDKNTKKG